MSIKLSLERGWFLCHKNFIDNLYRDCGLQSKPIFEILTPFRMNDEAAKIASDVEANPNCSEEPNGKPSPRKRKKKQSVSHNLDQEDSIICSEFLGVLNEKCVFRPPVTDPQVIRDNNGMVRRLTQELDHSRIVSVSTDKVTDAILIPTGARYYNVDFGRGEGSSLDQILKGDKFNLIVVDPPWHNKHVTRERERGRGYETYKKDCHMSYLLRGLGRILANDAVMAFWCTPSRKRRKLALDLMDSLGLKLIAKWLWLKVTQSGEPVVPFDHPHKSPFEYIYIGAKGIHACPSKRETKVLCSVPSAFQSHKPPLVEVLQETFPRLQRSGTRLEVFGRYLLPEWTTVGNECLQFQHKVYFESNS